MYMSDEEQVIVEKPVEKCGVEECCSEECVAVEYKNIEDFVLNNNIVRKIFLGDSKSRMDVYRGIYYMAVHCILIILAAFSVCFVENIWHLCAVLCIISLDAFSIVVLHNCPLTLMEQKYLGTSMVNEHHQFMKLIGVQYHCDHSYEQQIELLINVWMLIVLKILVLITVQNLPTIFYRICNAW